MPGASASGYRAIAPIRMLPNAAERHVAAVTARERHASFVQDRWVHEHDVGHGHECSQSGENFGLPICPERLKFEITFQMPGERAHHCRNASISTASATSDESVPESETSWSPSGSPFSEGMGIEMAGTPRAVHGMFITGSPVDSRPRGATPGAAGVSRIGYWPNWRLR